MNPKWFQNDPENIPKCPQNDLNMPPNKFPNDPKVKQKCIQSDAEMTLTCKMIPKWP